MDFGDMGAMNEDHERRPADHQVQQQQQQQQQGNEEEDTWLRVHELRHEGQNMDNEIPPHHQQHQDSSSSQKGPQQHQPFHTRHRGSTEKNKQQQQQQQQQEQERQQQLIWKHSGGGMISTVMAEIIDKLPPVPKPTSPLINGTLLMRDVHLSGDYQADTTLILPSYTTVHLEGSITPTLKLSGGDNLPQGNLVAALVLSYKADMVGVEASGTGALFDCSGWNSTNSTTNTSSLAGIWFQSVLGAWVRNVVVRNCGMGVPAGPRPMYQTGNIRIVDCFGASVVGVESHSSYNRGLWTQSSRVVVWDGYFHDNLADGIDFDSATSKSVAYNNRCHNNSRHGIFVEEGASYNVLVNNTCLENAGNGICLGSLYGPSGTNENTVLANILGPDDYPGSGGAKSGISFGGSDYAHRQIDLVAVGNTINGNVASHGNIQHSVFALNRRIASYEDFNMRTNDSVWLNNP